MKFNFKCLFGIHSWKKHIERRIGVLLKIVSYYCKNCNKQYSELHPPEESENE